MATASDRGWNFPDPKTLVRVPCAGLALRLRPEVAPIFAELIRVVEHEMGTDWFTSSGGYNFRPVRGYELKYALFGLTRWLSNHSWGLAADFRGGTNPQRANGPTDMPHDIEALTASVSPHLSWGGSWAGSRRDPMHWEYLGTPADARADVARLTQKDDDVLKDQFVANAYDKKPEALDYVISQIEPRVVGQLLEKLPAIIVKALLEAQVGEALTVRKGETLTEPIAVSQALTRAAEASVVRQRDEAK